MKVKVVNHKKFRRRIIILFVIVIGIILSITNKALSKEKVDYKIITVCEGDTLWSIAQNEQDINDYYENDDIREIVSSIKKVNNLNTSNLEIKQTLKIPIKIL